MHPSVRAVQQIKGADKPKITDIVVEFQGREVLIAGWSVEHREDHDALRLVCQ